MENEEKNQTEQDEKGQSVWKELWDYAKIILVVFVIAIPIRYLFIIKAGAFFDLSQTNIHNRSREFF